MEREKSYTELYLRAMAPRPDPATADDQPEQNATGSPQSRAEVMATLPSVVVHRSEAGTALGRKMSHDHRRLSVAVGADRRPSPISRRKSSMTHVMLEKANKEKGLKVEFDADDDEYDEVERLKQLDVIRQMPIPMHRKRRMRNTLFDRMPDYTGAGCDMCIYKWKTSWYRFRIKRAICWREFKLSLTLWKGAFKTIEGHFGSGVLTYFRFLKWLFQLNLYIFLMVFFFITLPQVALDATTAANLTDAQLLAANCSAAYSVNVSSAATQLILDFIQGTGWMEQTAMFYGFYSNTDVVTSSGRRYDMPLAYLVVCALYFLLSLVLMVKHTASGFRERIFANEESLKQYCNSVFGGWDYGMDQPRNVLLRQKSVHRELTCSLEADRHKARLRARTCREKCRIYSIRALINVVVLALLGAAGFLIYYVTVTMIEIQSREDYASRSYIVQFLVEFTTSLTITILNGALPAVFKKLVTFEDYTPGVEVNITLCRTVFLRLASIGVLIFSLYSQITCTPQDYCGVGVSPACTPIQCWETSVGQEFYKLVMVDFIALVCVTFFVEFPRKQIVTRCNFKLAKLVGMQKFDITKNVLDLIYSQVLLWLGTFFSPLISVICVIKLFLVFYIKELTVLVNYEPTVTSFRSSDTQAFFLIVLLCAFVVCATPVLFVVFRMTPSASCGPFSTYTHMYDVVPAAINTWPAWLQSVLDWICSTMILVPIFVILCLVIYYLDQMWKTYRDMGKVLREQLHLEGRDKQFLLAKIQELTGGSRSPVKNGKKPPTIAEEQETASTRHAPPYTPPNVPDVNI